MASSRGLSSGRAASAACGGAPSMGSRKVRAITGPAPTKEALIGAVGGKEATVGLEAASPSP